MSDNPYQEPNQFDEAIKSRTRKLYSLFGVLGIFVVLVLLLVPAFHRDTRGAVRRTQCRSNLKQIGLALHNYHERYQSFPPAYTADADGNPLHSWRALIVPFLDLPGLAQSIDYSKPWNHPANQEAFEIMPDVYRCPASDASDCHTTYLANAAADGVFRREEPTSISDITDGTSNTLMVIEVSHDKSVHWMEPRDSAGLFMMNFGPETDVSHSDIMMGLLCDGSVFTFGPDISTGNRHALTTISGNEIIDDF